MTKEMWILVAGRYALRAVTAHLAGDMLGARFYRNGARQAAQNAGTV